MLVSWVNRAEIAYRSLDDGDRRRAQSAIQRLRDLPPGGVARLPEIRSMISARGDKFFVYDIGAAMRLVFSINHAGAIIEDIAPTSRVERVA